MKYVMILIYLIFSFNYIFGQENLKERELTLRVGLSYNFIQDQRLSAITQKAWAPKYGLSYRSVNDKRISQINIQFASVKSRNGSLMSMNSIRPEIFYSYERKVKEGMWFGGFVDHNTLLNFPTNTSSVYENNRISYTIAQSIGPRVSYLKTLEGNKIDLRTSVQVSLLSYVVQPAFGHPYPTRYLEEGTFNPTREGMAWPLMKSGKVVSVNKFNLFRVELGFYYRINDSIKIGVDYNFNIQYANTRGKSSYISNHDIFLGATYIH